MRTAVLDEQEIRYRVSRIENLPVLPLNLKRILEIVANEVSSPDELEVFIRYDQALTARILRIANSTFYGFRGKVSSISRSILILGYDRVKSICLRTLLFDLLSEYKSIGSGERETLWKHAFATGRIASEMVVKRPWTSKEEAQTLGLLHDLGKLVVTVYFSEEYQAILRIALQRKVPVRCVESQFGLCHTLIGKWTSIRWKFPDLIQNVIAFHHEPEKAPSFKTETTIIALANILANSREYPEYLGDDCTQKYCNQLLISDEEWDGHQARLNEILSEVNQFWDLLASPSHQ
jgi:HD-like signal output (HDOD) protein